MGARITLLHTIKVNKQFRKFEESKAANKPKPTANGKAQ